MALLISDVQIKHAWVVMHCLGTLLGPRHCQGQSMQLFIHKQLINEQWPPPRFY